MKRIKLTKEFSSQLKAAANGQTQMQAAKAIGISVSYYGKIATGNARSVNPKIHRALLAFVNKAAGGTVRVKKADEEPATVRLSNAVCKRLMSRCLKDDIAPSHLVNQVLEEAL